VAIKEKWLLEMVASKLQDAAFPSAVPKEQRPLPSQCLNHNHTTGQNFENLRGKKVIREGQAYVVS
jgi:hypothetical protein